jgi:diadenylate cyclase
VSWINTIFGYIGITDVIDILATSVLIYYVLLLIRGTRAVQIITGVLVLAGLLGLANLLHLYLLGAILQVLVYGAGFALLIVFQPELRRALEQIGRGGLLHIGE